MSLLKLSTIIMRKKEYGVYTFDELSKDVQQKAIDRLRDVNTDFEWYEHILDDCHHRLKLYGFDNARILWSGFSSQGDGACFTGTMDVDGLQSFIEACDLCKKYKNLYNACLRGKIYVDIEFSHNFNYYHAYSTSFHDRTEMQDNTELSGDIGLEYSQLMDYIYAKTANNNTIGWYIDECNDIYKALESCYYYLISDEAIRETIEANECEFTKDGRID